MPDISSYNGIDMANIASINGQDIAAGGAYDPVADSGTYTETVPTTGLIHYGSAKNTGEPLSSTLNWHAEVVVNYSSDKDGVFAIDQVSAKNWSKIDAGRYVFAGIDTDGKLWMKSYSTYFVHQSSNATTLTQATSVTGVSDDTAWTDVSCGSDFVLAINAGKLFVVGQNGDGQLGTGDTSTKATLTQIGGASGDTDWFAVSAGDDHSAAIKGASGDRSLLTTGENADGKCGSGDTSGDDTSWTERVAADAGEDWTFVEAGNNHTIAILAGKLYVTGDGKNERFGNNSTSDVTSFTQSGRIDAGGTFGTSWVSGSVSGYKSMLINTSGEVWFAGEASLGTGSGTTVDAKSNYHVKTSGNASAGTLGSFGGSDQFTAIRCGRQGSTQSDYVWAAINNNTLYVFGRQNYGTTVNLAAPFIIGSTSISNTQGITQNSGQTCNNIAPWWGTTAISGLYADF
jgi:alpha-tubulin suppressor-like RCC1 family protein